MTTDNFIQEVNKYGFIAEPISGNNQEWVQKHALKKVVGVWSGHHLTLWFPIELAPRFERWKEQGFKVENGKPLMELNTPALVLDFYSESDMDYLICGDQVISFPEEGRSLLKNIQNEKASDLSSYDIAQTKIPFMKNLAGKAATQMGKISEAGAFFREAIELCTAYAEPYSNLGALLWEHGQRRDAFVLFTEAIIKNPNSTVCQLNFFDAGYELKEYSSMISVLNHLIKIAPTRLEFRHHIAICQYQSGRRDEAIGILNDILLLNPNDPEAKQLIKSFQEDGQGNNLSVH